MWFEGECGIEVAGGDEETVMLWVAGRMAVSLARALPQQRPPPLPQCLQPHPLGCVLGSKPHRCFPELLHVYWVSLEAPELATQIFNGLILNTF